MSDDPPLTISVPEAGQKYLDLSRNGSYNAAGRLGERYRRSELGACYAFPSAPWSGCSTRQDCKPANNKRRPRLGGVRISTGLAVFSGENV